MPNLLHPSLCQKQSLQMKSKGWGNPFLLIKAELGKRHEAGVYSLCCQWQHFLLNRKLTQPDRLFFCGKESRVQSKHLSFKEKNIGIPWPCLYASITLSPLPSLAFWLPRKRGAQGWPTWAGITWIAGQSGENECPKRWAFQPFISLTAPNTQWCLITASQVPRIKGLEGP